MAMKRLSRREYLQKTGVFTAGMLGLHHFDTTCLMAMEGYGPLQEDPQELLDLPAGFSYTAFSRTGEWMDDDLRVPGAHDGMAAFPGPNGRTILIRNHELLPNAQDLSAHGGDDRLKQQIPNKYVFDPGQGKQPAVGGTTTLVFNTQTQTLEKHFLSLTGTTRNCAGGPTPWQTWLTCEETVDRAGDLIEQDHGFVFEVPATTKMQLAKPIPYKAMGRFNHEAVAVSPATGIVYLTEDRDDGLIYRFLPERPGQLRRGGKLQVLRLKGKNGTSTRNWPEEGWLPVRQPIAVEWVSVENVEAPQDDLRFQGRQEKNAAIFARGEGIWESRGYIFWACTSGGPNQQGQIFCYRPSPEEGETGEEKQPGQLVIFCQPNNSQLLRMADNLTVAPWGDVIICEDGPPHNSLVGITPAGELYRIAKNHLNGSEFAGSTFSPDGSTLFVNIQKPGISLAIIGPWHRKTNAS